MTRVHVSRLHTSFPVEGKGRARGMGCRQED